MQQLELGTAPPAPNNDITNPQGVVRAAEITPKPAVRHSDAPMCMQCGVQMIHTKALANHSLPSSGDVTVGYVKPSIEALREATEKVARFLLDKAGAKAEAA